MALAAIEMALWDALARSHATFLILLYEGVAGSACSAEDWIKRGFKAVKAKIGYPSARDDLEVVRAIRKAVGDGVATMVDYNQCLTPAEAVQRLRGLDGEGLVWVEEPVLAHDYEGHALVASAIHTPIQCGENWYGLEEVRQAIHVRASDYIMLDVMKIGGVTGWLRASAIAEANRIPLSNHLWSEISAQFMSATPTAHYLGIVIGGIRFLKSRCKSKMG